MEKEENSYLNWNRINVVFLNSVFISKQTNNCDREKKPW